MQYEIDFHAGHRRTIGELAARAVFARGRSRIGYSGRRGLWVRLESVAICSQFLPKITVEQTGDELLSDDGGDRGSSHTNTHDRGFFASPAATTTSAANSGS